MAHLHPYMLPFHHSISGTTYSSKVAQCAILTTKVMSLPYYPLLTLSTA